MAHHPSTAAALRLLLTAQRSGIPAVIQEATRAAEIALSPHGDRARDMQARGCPYLRRGFTEQSQIIEESIELLRLVDFDTFVCVGVSGLIVAPLLAHEMNKCLLVVRKSYDSIINNHSGERIEGITGSRWIFVDDVVASGATRHRAQTILLQKLPDIEYVGTLLYGMIGAECTFGAAP